MSYAQYDPSVSAAAGGYAAPTASVSHSHHHHTASKKAQQAREEEGYGGGAKKGRKPYTITKPRESWTKEEHQFFLEALQLYERDWKKIGQHIPTKSIIQIRSHAQKYFIKMAKMGLKEFIPAPSRPKRAPKSGKKHRSKRQKGEDGEDIDDDEDEDGEDQESEDGDEEGGEEEGSMDAGGEEQNGLRRGGGPAASPAKAAARPMDPARRRPAPKPSSSSATRKPIMRRGLSQDSQGSADAADDANTRRSGRKRKLKKRFDDEEYGSGDEDGGDDDGGGGRGHSGQDEDDGQDEDMDQDHSNHQHVQHGGEQHMDSTTPSPYPHSGAPTPQQDSAPSTPLRKAGGGGGTGGLTQLSQLSPLSQLTQAGSLADITSPHLLPQPAYNPKLKPYPGLNRSRGAGGMGSNLAHAQNLQLPRPHPLPPSNAPSALAIDTEGDEQTEEPAIQPEFTKVYSFLGSLFDPSSSGHLEDELDKMTPVNKEIVQKLMQNLTTNLATPAAQQPSAYNDPLSRSMQLGPMPKHARQGSLGSIGSLDALGSPDMMHSRWEGSGLPSVSPVPPVGSILSSSLAASGSGSSSALTGVNGSPQPPSSASQSFGGLPRSYSSNGLSVNLIPPGSGSGVAGNGSALPPAGWSADKSRPGFASNALVSRITARGALSPLSVGTSSLQPSASWPAQGSPTPSTYANYTYANMSPGGYPAFVGSPGGLFSPATSGVGASAESSIPQYPKLELPAAAALPSGNTLTVPINSPPGTSRPSPLQTSPSTVAASASTGAGSGVSSIGALISPSSAAASGALTSLLQSPTPASNSTVTLEPTPVKTE